MGRSLLFQKNTLSGIKQIGRLRNGLHGESTVYTLLFSSLSSFQN
ncbi:MAG: hypothetical protein Q4Q19_06070 [Methanobrevibacter sp.]|nr:hypothetical protein [Methanobrevibacter sp.]